MVIIAAGLLVAVAVVLWKFVPGTPEEGGTSPQGTTEPAPGYALFEHGSGALAVEVPDDWDERIVVDSAGEKGKGSLVGFPGR
jgi:hypothetical protein